MKKIWFKVLERIVKFILSSDLYKYLKDAVRFLMNADMKGEDKRKRVFEVTKEAYPKTKDFLINLGIETAVAVLKELRR